MSHSDINTVNQTNSLQTKVSHEDDAEAKQSFLERWFLGPARSFVGMYTSPKPELDALPADSKEHTPVHSFVLPSTHTESDSEPSASNTFMHPPTKKKPPIFIDLTLDDEEDRNITRNDKKRVHNRRRNRSIVTRRTHTNTSSSDLSPFRFSFSPPPLATGASTNRY